MVKTYSMAKDAKKFCSPHTQVYEMRSKCGADKILICETLMDMIEKIFTKLRCDKYIVISGYRTPSYSVKVGGSKNDQHTKGKAVDAVFYDKGGKKIPAKIICCVAQDLGFNGIAYINEYEVHLDTGARLKPYLGDERKGTNSVTRNFYEYFGVAKADIAKYTGESVETKCYSKYVGTSGKIDTVLKEIKVPSQYIGSWRKRVPIAKANGIFDYEGTAKQNTQLISLAKQGFLRKP